MGVLPLQFLPGTTRNTLGLDGSETFDFAGLNDKLTRKARIHCSIRRAGGETLHIELIARLDSHAEVEYYRHGGIIKYVLSRKLAGQSVGA